MAESNIGKKSKIQKHDWHALPIPAVFEALSTTEFGLSESEVKERTSLYGTNTFSEAPKESLLHQILRQCKSPLTIVLIIAFCITLVLGEYVDAIVISLALLIAVVVGLFQEEKASRAFDHLSKSQVKMATVIRAGKKHSVETSDLVLGDIVMIQNGMYVPADIRILQSKKLSINESALTGEWVSVNKSPERIEVGTPLAEIASMAWMGTYVAEGYGMGVVVAVGDNTAIGTLAKDLSEIIDEITPLQWEMAKISKLMLWIIIVLVLGIFILGILQGQTLETMLLTSIAIAVASIPEGLPAAVTVILAVGMEALLKRGGLVRNLLAAETLGSTTYILTDKTGTLTEARMAIRDVIYSGCSDTNADGVCDWEGDAVAKNIFNIALCASDAYLDEKENETEEYIVRGEPIERAILESAHTVGFTLQGDSLRAKRIDFLAFESKNRFAAGLALVEKKQMLCVNGAPELLLEKSTKVVAPDGERALTEKERLFFENRIVEQTKQGKRLIAIGYKHVTYNDIPENVDGLIDELIFAGLLIIDDPVRADVKEAIKGVMLAGAEVRLVTGDNPETALSIAKAVGIAKEGDTALIGTDIVKLSDDELLQALRKTKVYARVLPAQKMRLVRVLQMKGEIVAMTGDGINDAPALRKANIGVAIGSGTEVAKESSDLILINDSFVTVHAAIEEGRRIISNLRKIVGYLLSTSLSEVVLIAGALITAGPIPILPAQILWSNIIEEGLMSVAFAFERGEKRAMKRKPKDINAEGVLNTEMLRFIAFVVAVLSILLIGLYLLLRALDLPLTELRSIMFLAISIDSLFIAFSFRSLTTPIWKLPLAENRFFMISFVLNVILLGMVITVPFLQKLLSYEPLSFGKMLMPLIYGVSTLVVVEAGKWFFFERKK